MRTLPPSASRGAVLFDRPRCLDDVKELSGLLTPEWPALHRQLMDSGALLADRQGFRTMQQFADPGTVNQTATSLASDTILWDPAGLAPNTAIPAKSIRVGQVFKVTAWGVTTTAVTAGQTVIFNPRFGTTVSGTSLGVSRTALVNAAAKTNVPWYLEMYVHFRSIGTAGTATCSGSIDSETIIGTAGGTNQSTVTFGTSATTPTTVDTTVASGLLVSVTPSLNTQTFQTLTVVMETLN